MSHRLLLADDSLTIQKVVELTFSRADFELRTVGSGDKAVEALEEFQPDVVLADAVMPGLNGYEVCEAVKRLPGGAYIPVVLLTGTFEPFDRARAERVGCDSIVTKPFDSHALVSLVRGLVEKARIARETAPPPAPPEPEPPAFEAEPAFVEEPAFGTPALSGAESFAEPAFVSDSPVFSDEPVFVEESTFSPELAFEPEPIAEPAQPAATAAAPPPIELEPAFDSEPLPPAEPGRGDLYATTAIPIPSLEELEAMERRRRQAEAGSPPPPVEPEATGQPPAAPESPARAEVVPFGEQVTAELVAPEIPPEVQAFYDAPPSADPSTPEPAFELSELAAPPVEPAAALPEPELAGMSVAPEPEAATPVEAPVEAAPFELELAEPGPAPEPEPEPEEPRVLPEAMDAPELEAPPLELAAEPFGLAEPAGTEAPLELPEEPLASEVAAAPDTAGFAADVAEVAEVPEVPEVAPMAEVTEVGEVAELDAVPPLSAEPFPLDEPVVAFPQDEGVEPEQGDIEEAIATYEREHPSAAARRRMVEAEDAGEPEVGADQEDLQAEPPAGVLPGELEALAAQTDLKALIPAMAGAAQGSSSGPLSEADVDRIARRVVELIGERVVREIAWDVVPEMAERLVRARLAELER